MFDKSKSYDISTGAPTQRRWRLWTTVLALIVIGLALVLAGLPSARASSLFLRQFGPNMSAEAGKRAAHLASDAVARVSQNRNITAFRFDLSHLYSAADEELFDETALVGRTIVTGFSPLDGFEKQNILANPFAGTDLGFDVFPWRGESSGASFDASGLTAFGDF